MYTSAKTIVAVYGKLGRMAEGIEGLIKSAAVRSFSDNSPCLSIAEDICRLIEKKNKLVNLKVMARRALATLTDEEARLLAGRYLGRKTEFFYSERTLTRKVNAALAKLTHRLKMYGLSEADFVENYVSDIACIGAVYDAFALREKTEKPAVKLNKTFARGSYRNAVTRPNLTKNGVLGVPADA